MDTITVIIILVALGLISLGIYFILRPGKPGRTTESLYSDGLRLLLEGKLEEAAEKLKTVVRKDTDHVDAYIKLGDIYRQNGQHSQALKVHQSLTVRRNLTPGQKIDIYMSLVEDHKARGAYEKALEITDKVLELDKRNLQGLRARMDLYRQLNRWEEAGELLQTIGKVTGEEDPKAEALYKIEEGRELERNGDAHEGRIRYRKALKIDPENCAALLYLGDSYDREERTSEAVENWKKFGEQCPELLHLVADKIEQRLFELGNFSEVEQYYKQLLKSSPENTEAATGLANIYEKKGEVQAAINSLENALEKTPDALRARIMLARLYNGQNSSQAVEEELDTILNTVSSKEHYFCAECGYDSDLPIWLCPECYEVDTFFDEQIS